MKASCCSRVCRLAKIHRKGLKRNIIGPLRYVRFGCVLRPGCGIVIAVPAPLLSEYMRVSFSILALIASWLCAVPFASAATRPERSCGSITHVGNSRTAFGQPGARVGRSFARRVGLGYTGSLLRRGTVNSASDDDVVIQDESPAARIDAGDRVSPTLQPLGTLASSHSVLPAHRILSRRSPRGPPAF